MPLGKITSEQSHNDPYRGHFLMQSANILASKDLRSIQHTSQSSSLLEFTWERIGIGSFWWKRQTTPASHPGTGLGCSWDTSPDVQALLLPQHRPIRKQRIEVKGQSRKRVVKRRAGGREEQQINMEYEDTEPKSKENCSQPFSGWSSSWPRERTTLGRKKLFKLPSCSCPFTVTHAVLPALSFKAQFCAKTSTENIWRPVRTYWQQVHLGFYRNCALGGIEASKTIEKTNRKRKR